ncbi:unnamed protein product, partial [Urochloa humidicola]
SHPSSSTVLSPHAPTPRAARASRLVGGPGFDVAQAPEAARAQQCSSRRRSFLLARARLSTRRLSAGRHARSARQRRPKGTRARACAPTESKLGDERFGESARERRWWCGSHGHRGRGKAAAAATTYKKTLGSAVAWWRAAKVAVPEAVQASDARCLSLRQSSSSQLSAGRRSSAAHGATQNGIAIR